MEQRFIQSFINAADTVLASVLSKPVRVVELTAGELRLPPAHGGCSTALVRIEGDVRGWIVFSIAPKAARTLERRMGGDISATEIAGELANMVVGNAVAKLNDSGFNFFVHPPEAHDEAMLPAPNGSDSVCLRLESGDDSVHMSIAMHCAPEASPAGNPYRT